MVSLYFPLRKSDTCLFSSSKHCKKKTTRFGYSLTCGFEGDFSSHTFSVTDLRGGSSSHTIIFLETCDLIGVFSSYSISLNLIFEGSFSTNTLFANSQDKVEKT